MSNVLIGIIGVILFIGLALAGALFLGPRFQSASNSSKASAVIQATRQVADAASMYELQEGKPMMISAFADLASKGYLKNSPFVNGSNVSGVNETGCVGCGTGRMVGASLYLGTDTTARAICEAVARQTGQVKSGEAYDPAAKAMTRSDQTTESGCTRAGSEYYVFSFV